MKEDKRKPKFEDIDISDLVQEEDEPQSEIVEKGPTKREKLDKKRKIEDYLDDHFPLNVCCHVIDEMLTIATEVHFQVQGSVTANIWINTT